MSSKSIYCSCTLCKSNISTANLNRHYNSTQCKSGGKYKPSGDPLNQDLICTFCNKQCKNKKSYSQHYVRCSKNPNHIENTFSNLTYEERCMLRKNTTRKSSNQFMKAKELGLHTPQVSEKTRKKLSTKATNRKHSQETKDKLSISMKLAVSNNPEAYSSSNRGRTKQIEKYGIKFQGNWELKFYEWCILNQISIVRNFEGFQYTWNGERTYFPDFYLPDFNTYVEIKGYKVERDIAKWSYFPHNLLVIQKYEIGLIGSNTYVLDI